MQPLTKQYYRPSEVSQLLEVPQTTLHWWEKVFPMFNPNRTEKGTRNYTQDDVLMAALIKELLYEKGMRTEAAIAYINKSYRKCPPRNAFVCNSTKDAIALLKDVKIPLEDAHSLAKIDVVIKYLTSL